MTSPRVTVLMPVFNVEKHLRTAIDSVLAQTFSDFEFLIIDDCSTDDTPAILASYRDPRIICLRNPQNLGIVASLNKGIELARGEYIARMDGDDICMPERLAAQVAHLDANLDTVLLGTKYVHIDDDGAYVYHGAEMPPPPEPGTSGYMRWSLLWVTSVQHPSAMIRREALGDLRYDAAYFTAEDYDLWARLGHSARVERLQNVHLHYRVNPAGISTTKREMQLETHFKITHRELCLLMGQPLSERSTRFLFHMVVPKQKNEPENAPAADVAAAMRIFWQIRERFLLHCELTAEERAHIERETDRVLRRTLAFIRNYPEKNLGSKMRGWILWHRPRLFAQLAMESGRARLLKR